MTNLPTLREKLRTELNHLIVEIAYSKPRLNNKQKEARFHTFLSHALTQVAQEATGAVTGAMKTIPDCHLSDCGACNPCHHCSANQAYDSALSAAREFMGDVNA